MAILNFNSMESWKKNDFRTLLLSFCTSKFIYVPRFSLSVCRERNGVCGDHFSSRQNFSVPNDTIIPLKLPKFYYLFHIIFVLYSSHNQAPKQKSTTFSTNSYNLSTAKCNKKLQIIGSVEISPFQFQWDQNSDFQNA